MEYRRLFIIRKDLKLSPGKMSAMVTHCAEAYWLRLFRNANSSSTEDGKVSLNIEMDADIMEHYVLGKIVKTICQARNKNQLMKAVTIAEDLGLKENIDFGLINDVCRTELTPENEDGTVTVGIWFKPLPTDISHQISKKYHLYMA